MDSTGDATMRELTSELNDDDSCSISAPSVGKSGGEKELTTPWEALL
jgi:hypothetical protein